MSNNVSTGVVTRNILGAAIGYENLPQFYKENLELHDAIQHIADDLFVGEDHNFLRVKNK